MHCPQCGQQPATDQIRFCTHCGFALGALKEFIISGMQDNPVRQRDIWLGAGLILVGMIKAFFLVTWAFMPWMGVSLTAGAFFGLLQLFFQLSPRQKGLSLGATLMFLSSIAALLAGSVIGGAGPILVMTFAIPIILFWQKLSAGFLKLFFDKSDVARQRTLSKQQPAAALPTASTSKAVDLDTNRVNQEAVPEPVSVIESTTKTLREERIS